MPEAEEGGAVSNEQPGPLERWLEDLGLTDVMTGEWAGSGKDADEIYAKLRAHDRLLALCADALKALDLSDDYTHNSYDDGELIICRRPKSVWEKLRDALAAIEAMMAKEGR